MRATRDVLRTTAIAAALLGAFSAATDGVAGDAPRAVDAIENDLVADDAAVRAKAAAELTDRFPDGAVAVPMLVDLLDDESPDVVAAAAKAIDSMAVAGAGPLAAWCADPSHTASKSRLSERLAQTEMPNVFGAFDLLAPVKANLEDSPDAASYAAVALVEIYDDEVRRQVASRLTALVRTAPMNSRSLAAAALAWIGVDRVALNRIAPTDHPRKAKAVAAAVDLLRTEGDLRSWAGARMLRSLRPTDSATIAAIVKALPPIDRIPQWKTRDDPHAFARSIERMNALLQALRGAGPAAAPAMPTLSGYLWGAVVPWHAVDVLLDLGKESDVVSALVRRPGDTSTIADVLASRRCAPDVVLPFVLVHAYQSRAAAAFAARYGRSGTAALPKLREMFASVKKKGAAGDAVPFADAVLAVAPDDADAVAYLTSAAAKQEDRAAWRALFQHGPLTQLVIARVSEELTFSADPGAAHWMCQDLNVVAERGPEAKALVPTLTRLGSAAEDDRTRASSARPVYIELRPPVAVALGRIGMDDASAVALLSGWRAKGDETIRVPAAQALRRIRAKK